MLSYLSAETSFVRAFGNRTLLLLLLCALTRTGDKQGPMSVFGLSINLNPGIIAVFGPVLALLLLIGLRTESNTLRIGRELVLAEAVRLPARLTRLDRSVYVLFWTPTVAAVFLVVQYVKNVVPAGNDPCNYDRLKHFYDSNLSNPTPSVYCMGNLTEGMPWIYPPVQSYVYFLVITGCAAISYDICRNWGSARGRASDRAGAA